MKTKLTLLLINLCLCAYSQHPHAIPEDDICIKTIFNIQDMHLAAILMILLLLP